MPNPPFTPLTLSVELWNDRHHVPQRRLTTEVLAQAQRADTAEQEAVSLRENEKIALERLSQELTGGNAGTWDEVFHAAASLRQRLEDEKVTSRTQAEAVTDLLAQLAQAQQERDVQASWAKTERRRAEQAEAALAEMQKILQDMTEDLEARWDMHDPRTNPGIRINVERANRVLAELQRRRSAPGQEKA